MKYVIFDLDGTLIDSMGVWEDIDIKFLKKHGIIPTADLRNKVKTLTVKESASLYKNIFSLPQSIENIIFEISKICENEYAYNVELKPGVLDYLEKLDKNGVKMCIATASSRINAKLALKRLNIIKFFEFIIGGEDIEIGKEDPMIFLECCKKFGAKPSEVVVFEDSLYAVKTAKKAGFKVVGVSDKAAQKDKKEIIRICDYYINNFKEIGDVL